MRRITDGWRARSLQELWIEYYDCLRDSGPTVTQERSSFGLFGEHLLNTGEIFSAESIVTMGDIEIPRQ